MNDSFEPDPDIAVRVKKEQKRVSLLKAIVDDVFGSSGFVSAGGTLVESVYCPSCGASARFSYGIGADAEPTHKVDCNWLALKRLEKE